MAEADSLLAEYVVDYGDKDPTLLSEIYAFRGEFDKSFEWLELAYERSSPSIMEVINYPTYRLVYEDVRWHKFISKLELPEGHFLIEKLN